ncbi:transposase [Nocardia sp. NPDC005366]|uniref:transposase n=1 Tax=Nocardia sp. NPDC005366 TaxID=3156878 RepID=UPI0033AFF6E3
MPKRYPIEQRERAVKMVLDRVDGYRSAYAACRALAPKLGVHAETLRVWVKQAQIDIGKARGVTSVREMALDCRACLIRRGRLA